MSKRSSKKCPEEKLTKLKVPLVASRFPAQDFCILALVTAALGISLYLSTHSSFGASLLGCGPDSGCDLVLGSRWSHLGPIPVSWLAVLVEALWIISLLASRTSALAAKLAVGCAATCLSSAVWFTALQLFVLKAFCPYCLVGHFFVTVAAVLQWRRIGLNGATVFAGWGCLAALGLVAGQALIPVKTSMTESLKGAGQSSAVYSAAKPMVSLYDGAFQLDPDGLPRMGRSESSRYVISLFDYTCHICRDLHHVLEAQLLKYPGEFQIINLVMPLCADCNPLIRKTSPAHSNACHIARLGLAVFRADPEKSAEFDRYLFEGSKPPAPEQAKAKAVQMVGSPALAKALDDPWIAQRIEENIRLYKSNYFKIRRGEMPQLMVGDAISVGAIKDPSEFATLLRNQWGLRPSTNQPSHPQSAVKPN